MTERQSYRAGAKVKARADRPSTARAAKSRSERAPKDSVPSAARSGRQAKQAQRRAELLQAARSLFVEHGWDKTSVATIVAKVGVAQGTFYLYFDSKENVLAHLRQQVLIEYVTAFDRGRQSSVAADEGLVAGLAQVAHAVTRNRTLVHVFRSASTGAQTEEVWLDGRERFATPLAELIRTGVARGEFFVDDARLAAHFLLALFDDLIYEASQYDRPAPMPTTLRLATRFALRALCVPPARIEALTATKPSVSRPTRASAGATSSVTTARISKIGKSP